MNRQLRYATGVSEAEYKQWCKDNKKPAYKASSKKEFFDRIADGRLVRDAYTGKLVKSRRTKESK